MDAADGHVEATNSRRISPPVATRLNMRSGAHNSWAGHDVETAVGRPIERRQVFGHPLAPWRGTIWKNSAGECISVV